MCVFMLIPGISFKVLKYICNMENKAKEKDCRIDQKNTSGI